MTEGPATEPVREMSLAVALVDLSHHVLHLFADVGRTYDLTQQQAELLCAVVARGRIRMTDLGRQLHMEKSGLSNLVDRAEQRGLVARTRDFEDRRVTWVELTSEGANLAIRTHSDMTARLDELVAHLSAARKADLADVIEQVLSDTGRFGPARAASDPR